MRKFLWVLLFSLFVHLLHAEEFPFQPPNNFYLVPKYLGLHHPVSTRNQMAQLYFDQGLTLIYVFNHDAAYWSFLRASQADPQLAMAYWGMALALGTNINMHITPKRAEVAYAAIQKAMDLSNNLTGPERDYIQALSQRYSNDPQADSHQLSVKYSDAMRALSKKYPDDPDAAVLFAESLLDLRPWNQWTPEGEPLEGTLEAVSTLENVLKRLPEHLGANHYYIHAIEASNFPEKGLICAQRLRTLLPISGHLLHMPSHIYMLVGDYQQAALSNEEAVAVDRAYIREYGIGGIYPVHYLSHNLYFLSQAYAIQGRFGDAKHAADELYDLYLPHFKRMPELEFYAMGPLFILMRFREWKSILNLPEPIPEMKMSRVFWHFGRAMAFAQLGMQQQAKQEQEIFAKLRSELPSTTTFGNNSADHVLAIAGYLLDTALVPNNEADQSLRKAIDAQRTLGYNEPPDWFYPIEQSLGVWLLKNNQPQEAERVFRQELDKHPRDGRLLFGLKESLLAQSKLSDAYWVNQEFEQAWKYSDRDLTLDQL